MSEAFGNLRMELPVAQPLDSAVVVPVREHGPTEREIFWVRRGRQLRFAGGFYAFPGGKVDRGDGEVPIDNCPDDERALRICALRETFEETGILAIPGARSVEPEALDRARRDLLAATTGFADVLAAFGLRADGSLLIPAGRWVTPPFSPRRFDARFFLLHASREHKGSIIPGELADGGWVRPDEALQRWSRGDVLLHPPNLHTFSVLAGHGPEAAVPRLRTPPFVGSDHVVRRIEFQRGIHVLPLRTPTLPPAMYTNCWIVGTGDFVIIDPGSPWGDQQARLRDTVRELISEGRRPRAVLLTHHHMDHVGGAADLAAAFDLPIRGSATTAERVPGVVGDLAEDDIIELDGPMPMRLRALLTEGHADGHLCFLDEGSRALIAGDMVAQGSTIVIDPPEGNMGRYMDSLRRLLNLEIRTLYPAHGFPIPDGPAYLEYYLKHRQGRLEELVDLLRDGPRSISEIVPIAYAKTPEFLHPAAARSALASLEELERTGAVRRFGEQWKLRNQGDQRRSFTG